MPFADSGLQPEQEIISRARSSISDDHGIVLLADQTAALPHDLTGQESWPASLAQLAKDGSCFFIDREDPICELQVGVTTEPPEADKTSFHYQPVGGNFLLRVPSGELVLAGISHWSQAAKQAPTFRVQPGSYVVQAHSREELDPESYEQAMEQLIGTSEYQHVQRVDRSALLGCVPLLVGLGLVLFGSWKLGGWVLLASALLWIPHGVLRLSRRYRVANETIRRYEQELPLFVLHLSPVKDTAGLVGGSIR